MSFLDEITPLKEAALRALQAADTLANLDDVRVQYLGANGQFTGLLKQMGGLAKVSAAWSARDIAARTFHGTTD